MMFRQLYKFSTRKSQRKKTLIFSIDLFNQFFEHLSDLTKQNISLKNEEERNPKSFEKC